MRHYLPGTLALCLSLTMPSTVRADEAPDLVVINRIMDEAYNRSEVMETLGYITDVIGPRLTGSPQLREANEWTRAKFEEWGLTDAHLEGYEFGRGWTFTKASARMMAPRIVQLHAIPLSWHPGTDGVITGDTIYAPIESDDDFEKYTGKLEGKIVLLSKPGDASRPETVPFRRATDESLEKLHDYNPPEPGDGSPDEYEKEEIFKPQLFAFLAEQGAIAAVTRGYRDAGLINATAYQYQAGRTPAIPAVSMASEDYRRILRLLDRDLPVSLELEVEAQFHDEDSRAYNTLADIRGKGRNPEIVMAGAHLDSWFMGDGAVDNGAGTAVVMEAARILKALDIEPKRTIRFALWTGEEQALYGSQTHVDNLYATRPDIDDEERRALGKYSWFRNQFPVTTKPGHALVSAYFNLDNGSGKIRGIYAEGNVATQAIFTEWLKPFHDLGATESVLANTGGTDHEFFQWVGLPAYQFIQDPLDYGSRLHHTQIDTLDHVVPEDLRQAAVIMASFLYNTAMRDDLLPRKPVPTKPRLPPGKKEDDDE